MIQNTFTDHRPHARFILGSEYGTMVWETCCAWGKLLVEAFKARNGRNEKTYESQTQTGI